MRASVTAALLLLSLVTCDPVREKVDPACEDYCAIHLEACTGDFAQYPSEDVCNLVCRNDLALPVGEEFDEMGGLTETGNSVYCRLTHSEYALRNPPSSSETHCPHSGPTGGNVCGSWCENYCHAAVLNCSEYIFDGEMSGCLSECEARIGSIPANGKTNDVSGNTIQCRLTHLALAGGEEVAREANCINADLENSNDCVGDPP